MIGYTVITIIVLFSIREIEIKNSLFINIVKQISNISYEIYLAFLMQKKGCRSVDNMVLMKTKNRGR